ncbi:hypothetical protein EJB05_04639, partial [Eragrostis curvula]
MSSGSSSGSSSQESEGSVSLLDLLDHIDMHYKEAFDRLPVAELPELIPRLLEDGVCLGLLDPVSNIIANTVCSLGTLSGICAGAQTRGRKRKADDEKARKRDEVMSEITTDDSNIFFLPPILRDGKVWKRRTVAQRSLEGLVTFLICYFRRLPVSEALRYLVLAKADLLAAVHLVNCSRGMGDTTCPTSSPTTLIALRCAAISASHPEPDILAARSLALASRHEQFLPLLTTGHCLSLDGISRIHKLLKELLQQRDDPPEPVWQATLCASRDIKGTYSTTMFPLDSVNTLRYLLLEKIHLLYLKAIARLPTDALCRRHHRGLLKAGLCFGPAGDPVSNIILNAIWYDTTFPPHVDFKVDVISTKSLLRIECRSLNGLLAFLLKLFPSLGEHDAMMYLFRTNASLQNVISIASEGHKMSSSYEDAYKSAAEAAWHSHPDLQAEFATSTHPDLLTIFQSRQEVSYTLASRDVELISSYYADKFCPGESVQTVLSGIIPEATEIVSWHKKQFMANQWFISSKVNAALRRYGEEKGSEYELHVVCGVNLDVPENGKHSYKHIQDGCPYAHINFLARPKSSNPDDTAPSRCFHCESEGNKIVHPAVGIYRGRETDFEELARGQRKVGNEDLIGIGEMRMEFVGVLSDDSVYCDPTVDSDFSKSMKKEVPTESFLKGVAKEFIMPEHGDHKTELLA